MKIEISGSVCVTCAKFTQYYSRNWNGELDAIDCGFCGQKGKHVRPGDRCSYYHEQSNVGSIGFVMPITKKGEKRNG